jgi:uncharacterized protein
MQIDKSVRDVERLFVQVDKATSSFTNQSGIKCPSGCTKCCHGKNVSAAPLEFLPYAYHLYQQGTLEDRFWELKTSSPEACFLVEGQKEELNGRCTVYQYRGLICRLFGSAAMIIKEEKKSFSGCSILKEQSLTLPAFEVAVQIAAPVYSDFYMQLRNIDNTYGSMMIPINMAILKSMEIVYYNTRRKRKRSV